MFISLNSLIIHTPYLMQSLGMGYSLPKLIKKEATYPVLAY